MPTSTAVGHRRAWTYTDDLGNQYRVAVKAIYVFRGAGAQIGGSVAPPTLKRLPSNLRMRSVLCKATGYPDMQVTCYTKLATLWTTVGVLTTRDVNGQDRSYYSTEHHREEKRPRDITRQST